MATMQEYLNKYKKPARTDRPTREGGDAEVSPSPSPGMSDEEKSVRARTGGYDSDEAASQAKHEAEQKRRLEEYEEKRKQQSNPSLAKKAIDYYHKLTGRSNDDE